LAITTGGARRMVQYELAQDQFILPLPAALTLVGSVPSGAANQCGGIACGGSYVVDGNPPSSCSGGTTSPAIGVIGATSDANLTAAIPTTYDSHYIGT